MASGPAVIDHHHSGHRAGDIGATIFLDQRQGHVDARGHAGRCPYARFVEKDVIAIHLDARVHGLQLGRKAPMGGRPPAIQKTTRGKQKSPHADAGGAACAGGRGADEIHGLRRDDLMRQAEITHDNKSIYRVVTAAICVITFSPVEL